jgi:hypothetical protein
MKNKLLFLIILVIIIGLLAFFYPKNVGGPLCGPVCPSLGLTSFRQDCLGFKVRYTMIDGYSDNCYGLPIGERKCYGIPYDEKSNFNDRELSCNYPCNDENIREICSKSTNITVGPETHSCEAINEKCNW